MLPRCLQGRESRTAFWLRGTPRACSRPGICQGCLGPRPRWAATAKCRAQSRWAAVQLRFEALWCRKPRRCCMPDMHSASRSGPTTLPILKLLCQHGAGPAGQLGCCQPGFPHHLRRWAGGCGCVWCRLRGGAALLEARACGTWGAAELLHTPSRLPISCNQCPHAAGEPQYHGSSRGAATVDWAAGTSGNVEGLSPRVQAMRNVRPPPSSVFSPQRQREFCVAERSKQAHPAVPPSLPSDRRHTAG